MLKEYRLKRGLTLEKLAEKCNISWRNLQRIENNPSKTKLETIKKIIMILNIEDQDILKFMKSLDK